MKPYPAKPFSGHFLETDLFGCRMNVIINLSTVSNKHLLMPSRHNHAFYEVFLINLQRGKFSIDGKNEDISGNTMIIVGPNQYHSVIYEDSKDNIVYSFRFSYEQKEDEESRDRQKQASEVFDCLDELSLIKCRDSHNGFQIIEQIKNELNKQEIGCNKAIESLIALLITNCFRNVNMNICEDSMPQSYIKKERIESADADPRLADLIKIEKYFADNLQDDKMLDSLAKVLHLSNRQTERLIQNYFGITFREKLIMTRIETAKDMLSSSELSIDDIAFGVGYSSRVSFSTSFKNYEGITPADYKKQNSAEKHTI